MTSDQVLGRQHLEPSVGASPSGLTSLLPEAVEASGVMRVFHDQERQERFDELGCDVVVAIFTSGDGARLQRLCAVGAAGAYRFPCPLSPTSVELFAVGPSCFWRRAPGTRLFDVPFRYRRVRDVAARGIRAPLAPAV